MTFDLSFIYAQDVTFRGERFHYICMLCVYLPTTKMLYVVNIKINNRINYKNYKYIVSWPNDIVQETNKNGQHIFHSCIKDLI